MGLYIEKLRSKNLVNSYRGSLYIRTFLQALIYQQKSHSSRVAFLLVGVESFIQEVNYATFTSLSRGYMELMRSLTYAT